MPAYKSFCWGLGTTSFRTKDFNKTIETQLSLLNSFWQLSENRNESWENNSELQIRYYDHMKEQGFVSGEAPRKDKDAREKTSGLVDIGLIDSGRKITEAGLKLLEISELNDFSTDNFLQIPKDSFLYLKQLLKTYYCVDGNTVRPFIVLIKLLTALDYISSDEYTYLLPLCISSESTNSVIQNIRDLRNGFGSIDDIIISRLMSMDNYQTGLNILLNNEVTEDLICEIGMNRKSRNYDKPYYSLYNCLYQAYMCNDEQSFYSVFEATRKIKIGIRWRNYLFNTVSKRALSDKPLSCLNSTLFDNVTTESEFKEAFFKVMHLLKAKATLSDYLDLNRRYIKTSDIVLFDDSIVKLDIVPKHFFGNIIEQLYELAFEESDLLFNDCSLEDISDCLIADEETIIDGVNAELGTAVTTIEEARGVLEDIRYERLHNLIEEKFTNEKLLYLLDCFENRNDNEIRTMVTDNADVPTIFEYVLGIIWYKVSECHGKVLDYLKLSLDANLLPVTHAAGGEADIVYEYSATEKYPEHVLLLEATLADGTNQRRMEMEPVSRHLGSHLLRTGNLNSYCIFATTYLDINVIADFRNRKNAPFYNTHDYSQFVNGMKIIPLQTTELKQIIICGFKYKDLYEIFGEAYNSALLPHEWYINAIQSKLV